MELLKLKPGESALYKDRIVLIKQVDLLTTKVWCDYADTGEKVTVPISQLRPPQLPLSGGASPAVPFQIDLAELSPKQAAKTSRKKLIVLEAESIGNGQTVREVAQKYSVHPSTIYRHINQYNAGGREDRALLERVKGGKGNKRIPAEVESIINQAIENIYLTRERNSISLAYEEVRRLCYRGKIKPVPSYDTVRRRIGALPQGLVDRKRQGAKHAHEYHGVSGGSVCDERDIPFPLHTVEIDSSPIDVILVDEYHRQPLGRAHITLAVDVFSRMILGFHLSLDAVSADSVAQCIAHTVCAKELWLEQIGVDAQWPCWGIPERFRVDNGSEFRNGAYQAACTNYTIQIDYRTHVEDGAVVERLIGTAMRNIHQLPGTTQANVQQKGDYDAQQKATLTLKAFEVWFTWWVIKYNNQVHAGIGMSPISKYLHVFKPPGGELPTRSIPPYITNTLAIRLDFAPFKRRSIQRKGVVIDHIWYYDPVFKRLRYENKDRQYVFRRLPGNIGSIWLRDSATGKYAEIKYADVNRPPISIWELRAARRRLEDRKVTPDEETIFGAVEAMRAIVLQEHNKRDNVRLTVATNRTISLIHQHLPRHGPAPGLGSPARSAPVTPPLLLPLEDDSDEVKPFGFLI